MIIYKHEPIFVIGPARSGTHLLASSIANSFSEVKYLAEINEFWNRYNSSATDYMTNEMFTSIQLKEMRKSFYELASADQLILEKTASNCLRLSLLFSLFPKAKFLIITRNNHKVIESVERKVLGDPRKISRTNDQLSFLVRVKVFWDRLKTIKDNKTMTIGYFVKNYLHYFGLAKSLLIGVPIKAWGPKFSSDKNILALEPRLYAQKQLESCLAEIEAFKLNDKVNFLEVRFEDLVATPQIISKEIESFLGLTVSIDFKIVGENK